MIVKCVKCEKVKELDSSELQEAGELVEKRKLKAVGFLNVLSLDLREENLCKIGKSHQWEFEPGFDKEIHAVSKEVKNIKDVISTSEKEIKECEKAIEEITIKMDVAKQRSIENGDKAIGLLDKIGEIAYIKDESLWT